jgi:hypothetical protein
MRKFYVLMLVAAGMSIAVPAARADQPIITPAPSADYVDSTSCAFPVSIHYTVNGETAKTFSSGVTIITGPLFAQFSANGKSVTLNISGPGVLTASGAATLHGVSAGPLVTPTGLVLSYVAGVVSASFTPTLSGVLDHGTVLLNICDALAP